MSTAYVNCDNTNKDFLLSTPEMIVDKDFDAEETYQFLKSKSAKYLNEHEATIIGTYPNTYTFTKNISERMLQNRRGDLPMVIIRPSIVGAAYQEPMPGWVDNLAALSGFIFVFGLGIINEAPGKFSNHANFIPVDFVVNAIIATACSQANKDSLLVCHSASPKHNSCGHTDVVNAVIEFSEKNPFERKAMPIYIKLYDNPVQYRLRRIRRFVGKQSL